MNTKNTETKTVEKTKKLVISGEGLTIDDIFNICTDPSIKVAISADSIKKITASYDFLHANRVGKIVYGVNTGFGPMATREIADKEIAALQENLIRSHAVGMGAPIRSDFVRAAMTVRLNALSKGMSGVSVELVERLADYINNGIIPVVPDHGAVGTSGDLVQLAHIALSLIGEGEAFYRGQRMPTADILKKCGLSPVYKLKPKEGLALINGTSVMTGIAAILCHDARRILNLEIHNSGLALEIVHAHTDGFSKELQAIRPHAGQISIAASLEKMLSTSKLLRERNFSSHNNGESVFELPECVQEVYSLRCTPQILGPIRDALVSTWKTVETEINSVTDNPISHAEAGKFLHGGNFHGDYISLAVDHLKIALVKLSILAERRVNFFLHDRINGKFPPFINMATPGLTLGLQALQFVATSTTARNQTLAFPQYVHSIPTNADNQDVVSMGTDSALIFSQVIENAYIVSTIESVVLAQAADFAGETAKLSKRTSALHKAVRKNLPTIIEDRVVYDKLDKVLQYMKKEHDLEEAI